MREIDSMYGNIISICGVLIILGVTTQCLGECPVDAPRHAMLCLADVKSRPQHTSTLWDYDLTVKACQDGAFNKALACAQSILTRCKDNQVEYDYLKQYLDIDKMKTGIDGFCAKDLKALKPHSNCIKEQRSAVWACAQPNLEKFKKKVTMTGGDRDARIRASCTFMDKAYSCQVTTVRAKCGDSPADILHRLMSHFRLPSCSKEDEPNSATIVYVPFYAKCVLLVFAIAQCL